MVPSAHTVVVCVVRGGEALVNMGVLKLFSSSLKPMLVEAEYLTTAERL